MVRRMLTSPVQQAREKVSSLRTNSLLRNSLYLMTATIVTSLLGYVYWTAAARLFPTHDVGLASALISAVTLAALISSFGLGPTLISWLPRRSIGRDWSLTLNVAFVTGAASGFIAGAALVVLLPMLSSQFAPVRDNAVIGLTVLTFVPVWTITQLFDCTFIAERSAGNLLLRNAVFAMLKILLLLVPLLFVFTGIFGILSSWLLASLLSVAIACWALARLGRQYAPTIRGARAEVRTMFTTMTGNQFTALGASLPVLLLPTIVTIRLSATDNAYFYTTWMMGGLFFMVSISVSQSLFAEGAHAAEHLRRNVLRSARIIVALLAVPMLVYIFAGQYIMGLFGPEYAKNGFALLMLLTAAAVPDAITNIYVAAQRVLRRLQYAAALNVFMGVVTIALAWFLLPVFGVAGAGLAWLAGQSAGSIAVGIHIASDAHRNRRLRQAGRFASA